MRKTVWEQIFWVSLEQVYKIHWKKLHFQFFSFKTCPSLTATHVSQEREVNSDLEERLPNRIVQPSMTQKQDKNAKERQLTTLRSPYIMEKVFWRGHLGLFWCRIAS